MMRLLLCVLLGMMSASRAVAADTETRDFTVQVLGKQAGTCRHVIQDRDDGSTEVSVTADVNVSYFGKTYTYTIRGSETWKNNRLVRIETSTNDDGKKMTVSGAAERDGLRITANGVDRTVRPDVWLSTYWRVPDPAFVNKQVPLIDADSGKDLKATLEYLGKKEITVLGRKQSCHYYRLKGDVKVELWYDAQTRLVRQESIEDGHKTVLELSGVRR